MVNSFLYFIGEIIESCCCEILRSKAMLIFLKANSIRSFNKNFSVGFAMGESSAIGLKHLDLSIGIPNHTLGYKLAYFQDVRVF